MATLTCLQGASDIYVYKRGILFLLGTHAYAAPITRHTTGQTAVHEMAR
jgi:hypothetical protein